MDLTTNPTPEAIKKMIEIAKTNPDMAQKIASTMNNDEEKKLFEEMVFSSGDDDKDLGEMLQELDPEQSEGMVKAVINTMKEDLGGDNNNNNASDGGMMMILAGGSSPSQLLETLEKMDEQQREATIQYMIDDPQMLHQITSSIMPTSIIGDDNHGKKFFEMFLGWNRTEQDRGIGMAKALLSSKTADESNSSSTTAPSFPEMISIEEAKLLQCIAKNDPETIASVVASHWGTNVDRRHATKCLATFAEMDEGKLEQAIELQKIANSCEMDPEKMLPKLEPKHVQAIQYFVQTNPEVFAATMKKSPFFASHLTGKQTSKLLHAFSGVDREHVAQALETARECQTDPDRIPAKTTARDMELLQYLIQLDPNTIAELLASSVLDNSKLLDRDEIEKLLLAFCGMERPMLEQATRLLKSVLSGMKKNNDDDESDKEKKQQEQANTNDPIAVDIESGKSSSPGEPQEAGGGDFDMEKVLLSIDGKQLSVVQYFVKKEPDVVDRIVARNVGGNDADTTVRVLKAVNVFRNMSQRQLSASVCSAKTAYRIHRFLKRLNQKLNGRLPQAIGILAVILLVLAIALPLAL